MVIVCNKFKRTAQKMRNFTIFIAIFSSIFGLFSSQSIQIDIICSYEPSVWNINVTLNSCAVENKLVVIKRNSNVKSVKIITKNEKADLTEIKEINIKYVVMYFMVKGFANHLKNIIALNIGYCQLKEISRDDLKVFPKLKYLWIWENELEVLEADLFKFNPEIIYINLYWNFLKSIDSNIFNNLKSLKFVYIHKNICISSKAYNQDEMNKLLEIIKNKCKPNESAELIKKIGNFARKSQIMSIYFYLVLLFLVQSVF